MIRQLITLVIAVLLASGAAADTTLVFGFDTTDNGTDINGITYQGSKQSITFSGAVSGSNQTTFNLLDEVNGQVNFLIGSVGDLPSLNGTMISSGGAFNIGGYGGGVIGGDNNQIDYGESWTFTFSRDVTLTSARHYGGDDVGQTVLTNDVAVLGSPFNDDFSGVSIFVKAGDSLTFGEGIDGQKYALQDFTITVVPEPATIAMIFSGGLIALLYRRFVRRYKMNG